MHAWTIVLEYDPDDPGYSVRVPALPGCYSQGDTVEEALVNAKEAIAGHLAALAQINAPIPEEGQQLPAEVLRAVMGAGPEDRVRVGRIAA
jgi:antitoxin HicB